MGLVKPKTPVGAKEVVEVQEENYMEEAEALED